MMRDGQSSLVLFAVGSLRLADNPALQAAIARGGPVIPVFAWTPIEDGQWAAGGASRWWLHVSLTALDAALRARGSRLIIRRGTSTAEVLEATSRSLSDALALSDAHGDVLAVNAAYSKLYGFAEPEVVGRSFAVIFPEEERTAAETAYREVFQSAASPVFRTSIRRADGAGRRVESRITFIERRKSRVAMLSVIRDITTPARVGQTVRGLPTKLDMGALASMYETHARSSLGYAHALLRDVAQAEQVVEDAVLAAWRAGVEVEHDNATARLLLFSVVRRSAVEVLASRIRTRYASGKVPNHGRSFQRWWVRLAQ